MSNTSWKEQLTLDITDTDACGRNAKFALPASAVASLFADAAKTVSRKAQIPGFRPGKAPLAMVKARYQSYVSEEADRLIQITAFDLLAKKAEEIDIVSYSKLQPEGQLEEGKDFSLKCDFEVAPEINLPDYNTLGTVDAGSEDIAKIENDLLEHAKAQYSTFVPIQDAAKEGDMLRVSFESDFVLPDNASDSLKRAVKSDSSWIYMIGQEMIPGVNAALTGATIGGEYTFTADYPADWHEEGLRGQKVTFKMKVHEGQRRESISDLAALAEKMNYKTVEDLNKFFHDNAIQQAEYLRRAKTMESIQNDLLEKTPAFDLPKTSLESAANTEYSNMMHSAGKTQEDADKFNADKDVHMEEAKKKASEHLRKQFIVRKIAKLENVKLSEQEIGEAIENMAQQTGIEFNRLVKFLQNSGRLNELEIELLVEKTLGVLAARRMKPAAEEAK